MNREKMFILRVLAPQINSRFVGMKREDTPNEEIANMIWDAMCEDGIMHLGKAKYPDPRVAPFLSYYWPCIYADTIIMHHIFDDDYSRKNTELVERSCNNNLEGSYCYENITVEKDDVVIDAGAALGDWSAVAAQMGGRVFAFEPTDSPDMQNFLHWTGMLNNFTIIRSALGEAPGPRKLRADQVASMQEISKDDTGRPCEMTTLDEFARKNNLHVDFVKSDIEGYERFMLKGATRVLQEDEPKLSIKTYHKSFGDDSKDLPILIKNINPRYKIIEKKKILYAYVD